MFTHPHKHPLLRRITGSVVGALLSVTIYSAYEDVAMAVRVHAMAADQVEHQTAQDTDNSSERIKAFAEQLKNDRFE